MELINLQVLPLNNMSAIERTKLISAELFCITRPISIRDINDVSNYLFGWLQHPSEDKCILRCLSDYTINVHPDKNLDNLLSLLPELSIQEKTDLVNYINNVGNFKFVDILPSNVIIIEENQIEEQGYLN